MDRKKSLNRITILNIISTVLLQGISFLTAPVFSRLMGTANYGIYSTVLTWSSVVTYIFGLQTAATIPVAPANFPEEDQDKYQSSILSLSFCSFALLSVLTIVFLSPISTVMNLSKPLCILVLLLAFGKLCLSFFNAKFTTEFKADSNMKLSLCYTILGVVLSLVLFQFIPASVNYYARVVGLVIADVGISLGLCFYLFRRGKTAYHKAYWKFCLPIAIPCVFHSLSGIVLEQSDRVMIQRLLGDSQAGIYSLTFAFGGIISIIYLSLNSSWVPFYFRFLREKQTDQIREHGRNYTELFTVLSLGFVLLAPEVFHIFADREFWGGTQYIPLFVIAHYFTFLYSFPVNYESFCRQSKIMAGATMTAAAVNIVLNYFLILRMGVLGAVIASTISHLLQFVVHHVSAQFFVEKGNYPFRLADFLPYLIAVLVVSGACFLVGSGYWFVRWGLGAVLGCAELLRIIKRKAIF